MGPEKIKKFFTLKFLVVAYLAHYKFYLLVLVSRHPQFAAEECIT
jgi:hypothetical protein